MSQFSHRYEPERVVAEPRAKLSAAVVGHRRDLKDCAADPHPAARRQVVGGKIELQKQAISEQGERLAVRDQLGHVLLHDGNLHVALWLRGAAPRIARNPRLRRQDDPIQDLPPPALAPPRQQSDPTVVLTPAREGLEHLFQVRKGPESIGIPDRVRINGDHISHLLLVLGPRLGPEQMQLRMSQVDAGVIEGLSLPNRQAASSISLAPPNPNIPTGEDGDFACPGGFAQGSRIDEYRDGSANLFCD